MESREQWRQDLHSLFRKLSMAEAGLREAETESRPHHVERAKTQIALVKSQICAQRSKSYAM